MKYQPTILQQSVIDNLYVPDPVGIVEFCESSDYCGRQLYPAQRVLLKLIFLEEMEGWEEDILSSWIRGEDGVIISPMIRERRDWLRQAGFKHFRQVVEVLGRRSGKGYTTGAATAKKIYDTSRLPDPGAYYGIDSEKEILFACIAASMMQARDQQFNDIANWIKNCKPLVRPGGPVRKFLEESFTVHTAADLRLKAELKAAGINVAADWAKLICKPMAANAGTIRGTASMVLIYDEMAHMIGVEGKSSAEEVFAAAMPSLRQFGRDGMSFCNSTPFNMGGQFYEEAQKGLAMEDDAPWPMHPTMFMIQGPSWIMFRHWRKDPKRRFFKPLYISPDDDPNNADGEGTPMNEEEIALWQIAREEERGDPVKYAVETRAKWQTTQDAFLNPEFVDRAFAPFNIPAINFSRTFEKAKANNYNFAYAGHCDPSSTTAGYGAALAHVEMLPDPHYPDEIVPHVVFDFLKRWNPADFADHTIDYLSVQKEIAEYITWFKPYQWTFDQYESTMPIQWLNQELRRRKITCRVFEQTFTNANVFKRYATFRTAVNLGLVHFPRDCGVLIDGSNQDGGGIWGQDANYAMWEMKFLIEKNGKIEKPTTGPIRTKDVADCAAEVTAHLIGDWVIQREEALKQGLRVGAEGGYRIGGNQPGGPYAGGGPAFPGQAQRPDGGSPDTFRAAQRMGGQMPTRGIQRPGGRRRGY